jgi:anti-anti-sigma factor
MWQPSMHGAINVLTWKPGGRAREGVDQQRPFSQLDALMAAAPGQRWVLEVGAIPMMSSEDIAQLIGAVRRIGLDNGRMALARPAPGVATVLRMTRLTKLLPMYDDLEQALKALA